ncbi:replication protein RepA [Fimbriiglobus ruber]|uniref:IncW-like replication protein n=1 Tax=Fimbriiglobus ruber TaxID=1908690 RepID=A0A225E1C0_9BACT|nr:replication protein RepA [Fimbriiglobus ruber]OWK45584.1 IncW-like replication protein [Fimbriiglobus ruber]
MTDHSVTQLTLTRHQKKLIDASAEIRSVPPEHIDFLHTIQCQIGLPYRNPGDDVREWDRKQGNATMRIEAGSAINSQGNFVHLGLPYGEKPRLVLIHLASEAVRTSNPVIDVDQTMTSFARSLGLDTNGRQLKGLKDQLARLASATARMGVVEDGRAVQVNTQIVAAFDLWFPKQADQRVLWPSTVRLSEEYFRSLGKHAVPLDHRAVAALSSSSMALDVYAWLAQRLHRIPAGKPQPITWLALYEQFGQGFARLRDFRRNFLHTLHTVIAAYPQARIDADEVGLTLSQSPPPVPLRSARSLPNRKADAPTVSHGHLVASPTSTDPAAGKEEPAQPATGAAAPSH